MAWIPEFPTIWNEQILELGKLAPTLRVTIYSVNLEMEKVCDRIPLPAVPPLEKSRWHYGNDGVLKGGSPLVDAVIRGCQKAQQYRRRGFAGPIGLFLFTDGWSKNDINAPREAEKWLAHARSELGITFRMFGFLHKYNKAMLSVFSQEIGLRPEEDQMMAFNQHPTREQTVRNSLEKFKEEIQSTICESLDAPLPQLNR